jgi:hypothetical protein
MKRVEIMVNQSVAEDLQEHLENAGLMDACTRWSPVYGWETPVPGRDRPSGPKPIRCSSCSFRMRKSSPWAS